MDLFERETEEISQDSPEEVLKRRELVLKIKREIAASTYKIRSKELAEKIGQKLREDVPPHNIQRKYR